MEEIMKKMLFLMMLTISQIGHGYSRESLAIRCRPNNGYDGYTADIQLNLSDITYIRMGHYFAEKIRGSIEIYQNQEQIHHSNINVSPAHLQDYNHLFFLKEHPYDISETESFDLDINDGIGKLRIGRNEYNFSTECSIREVKEFSSGRSDDL